MAFDQDPHQHHHLPSSPSSTTSSSSTDEPLIDTVPSPSSSDTSLPPPATKAPSSVTLAIPSTATKTTATTTATTPAPIPDSRRLFQRLWTDEDEIELLQGFLHYTSSKPPSSSHHHHHNDTAAFYDQIKSKLQLDFNKNQLVEKLRRLKKKFRTVLSRISAGKDLSFKSPHDQATFEISRKIWSHLESHHHRQFLDIDDDVILDLTPNPNPNPNPNSVHLLINLNTAAASDRDQKPERKRVKIEEECDVNANVAMQGMIEESVRSCLKEGIEKAVRGAGAVALNAVPVGDLIMECKWRKQQILELEVYSKRLELVQDQIKVTLDELRSIQG